MKTAVSWLEDMIIKMEQQGADLPPLMIHIQQAKEMEKQQIVEAYEDGYEDGYRHKRSRPQQYYNETFKP